MRFDTVIKTLMTAAAVVVSVMSLAQDVSPDNPAAPDDRMIEAAVVNLSSPYYYPHLFARYEEGDTTLTLQDYRHLYYGFRFDDRYEPTEPTPYADSITLTLSRNIDGEGISPELFGDLWRQIRCALDDEPFNMRYLNLAAYMAQMDGDMETAESYARKLRMIKVAIMSSGTGLTKDSPWHVLYRNDETDILASLGARPTKRMYITFDVEYFHLPVRNNGNKGYYFNNGRIYSKGIKRDSDGKHRFEFNPRYNPKSSKQLKNIEY